MSDDAPLTNTELEDMLVRAGVNPDQLEHVVNQIVRNRERACVHAHTRGVSNARRLYVQAWTEGNGESIHDIAFTTKYVRDQSRTLALFRSALIHYADKVEDQARMNSMACDGGCIDAPCHHGLCRSAVRGYAEQMRDLARDINSPTCNCGAPLPVIVAAECDACVNHSKEPT